MTIEDRNLEAGTKLAARYKGTTYTAELVQTDEGIRYRTEDGQFFKSPSKAGSHVMKGVACNGWRFWSREDETVAKPEAANIDEAPLPSRCSATTKSGADCKGKPGPSGMCAAHAHSKAPKQGEAE